ncbi:MAG TPA: polyprenyl synthetase family protein [Pyrinomonadaceae bacterium]|nr:polyprenyl synthetase family protein [Pyrinomonadaceae bacterium]
MQTFVAIKEELIPQNAARKIFSLIKPEMAMVEAEFERQASSNVQVINYLGDYLRQSGGKRVRPALLVLAAHAVGGDGASDSSIRLATVMEMLHTATLVHDDIIDNADLRRSRASVNAKFGNQAAVLMGDWLYMSAFETSLKERSLEILDILTRLTRKMTEGELIQLTMIGNTAITRDEYFDILRRKTAYLFSGCAEIGAILGGAGHDQQIALREYGMNLGIAFQLADDLLDFTADERALGKAAGADLLEGKVTLPLILLQEREPGIREELERVMYEGVYDDATRQSISKRLSGNGTLDSIRQIALSFALAARKNLDILPESEYRFALDEIPNFVIDRNS